MHPYGMKAKPSQNGEGAEAGVVAAIKRNPNKYAEVNDTPCGPYAHNLGFTDDGGMDGNTAVKHRGGTFHFK